MTVYLKAHVDGRGTINGAAEPFRFPGGEWHLKKIVPEFDATTTYIADVRGGTPDELMLAGMLADVAHEREMWFVLLLPYLPAARADRGEPTGGYVYAKMINAIGADQVIGIDPHSEFITKWIKRLTVLDPVPLIKRALFEGGHDARYTGVIAPDEGAVDRAWRAAYALGVPLYCAKKHRDFETGKILSYEMVDGLPKDGCYLVVDDICDGGGTFKMLATETGLRSDQLGLWVTHGIFSGEAYDLNKYYRHIYTTDSHPGHSKPGWATVVVPTFTYMHQNIRGIK